MRKLCKYQKIIGLERILKGKRMSVTELLADLLVKEFLFGNAQNCEYKSSQHWFTNLKTETYDYFQMPVNK